VWGENSGDKADSKPGVKADVGNWRRRSGPGICAAWGSAWRSWASRPWGIQGQVEHQLSRDFSGTWATVRGCP
jgi:hypothetical protein